MKAKAGVSSGRTPSIMETEPKAAAALDALADLLAERVARRLAEQDTAPGPYLSVAEAAAYLRRPKSRIYELVSDGRLRAHRDGRTLLFRRADLDAALQPPETTRLRQVA